MNPARLACWFLRSRPGLGGAAWRARFVLLVAGLWTACAAQAQEGPGGVYVSEIQARNRTELRDEDGESPGWIELYNGGTATAGLGGWHLTDTTNRPAMWRFPAVEIAPGKCLVVFASGKNRTNPAARLHTSFVLNPQGGYLALASPDGRVVSAFAPGYPAQNGEASYGRARGEPGILMAFDRPTPGKPNAVRGAGFSSEVRFSAEGGVFNGPVRLELSTAGTTGAVIRYTLDGSLPRSNSAAYTQPLSLTNTARVRARAWEAGQAGGPSHQETYVQARSNAWGFTSDLPVIVMTALGRSRSRGAQGTLAQLTVYEPSGGRCALSNRPALSVEGAFHTRGSSSGGLPQPGYAVQLLDEYDQEKPRPLLGLPAESDWVLYAPNAFEPVLIHNPFVHQLSREMGRYSSRTRFVEVFFSSGAGPLDLRHYQGLYVLEEKIKIGRNRVDIDRLAPEDIRPPEVTGGYLLKIDRPGPGEGGFSAAGVTVIHVDPKESVLGMPQRAAQRRYLESYFDAFDRALMSSAWKDPVKGYRQFVDVDSWIDFHVLETLSGNVDTLVLSTYFHKPREGKIVFGPHWDFDRALGSTDGRDADPRNWNTGRFFSAPWWDKLFRDPDFWQAWVDRWQELRQTLFSREHLEGLIDQLSGQVRQAQPRQYAKWGLQARGGSYDSEVQRMKSWLSKRIDEIDGQLAAPPKASFAGPLLTLSAETNATVYYTLDGSDPRQSQGGISSNAVVYAKPFALAANACVVARARNPARRQTDGPPASTPWSGPVTVRSAGAAP